MSLWSWLFDKLARPNPNAPRECSASRDCASHSVATLTPPVAPIAQSNNPGESENPWWTPKSGAIVDPKETILENPGSGITFLESVLVSHFDGHDLSMPMLNTVAERVLPKLRSADCNLKHITREIAEDQVLAAAVLRTANSPLYRGIEKSSSLPAAITRIGVKTLRTILLHQSMRSAVFAQTSTTRHFANVLWRRSIADACIMRGLASLLRLDEDEHHLIGLMHDIGGVLVLRIINDQLKKGCATIDLDSFEHLSRQTHQEFGELVAKSWQLPPDLCSLITDHHRYPTPDDPLVRPRWMLILTEMIGAMLYSEVPANYDVIHCPAAESLGLAGSSSYVKWLNQLPPQINEALAESES